MQLIRQIVAPFYFLCYTSSYQFKETGVNPVRARRREVQNRYFSYPFYRKTGEKPLDSKSEKVKNMHQVEILADKNIFKTASAGVSDKCHLRDEIKF